MVLYTCITIILYLNETDRPMHGANSKLSYEAIKREAKE